MGKKLIYVGVALMALLVAYPVVYLLTGSAMGDQELQEKLGAALNGADGYASFSVLPIYPTFKGYVELLLDSPHFFVMFWNSVKISALILAGQIFVSLPAAWAFAKYEFPLKKLIFTLYVILMLMPFQVMMLSNYLALDALALLNKHGSVILPAVFSTFPVFMMRRFFESIPDSILESAKLDGAGHLTMYLKIGLPLGYGGIIAALTLSFLECWNMIEQPLVFLKDQSMWPLSIFLPNIETDNASLAFAASVVTLVPSVFIFLAGQNYLEQGIVASAVKE